jgi:hypothetical protein
MKSNIEKGIKLKEKKHVDIDLPLGILRFLSAHDQYKLSSKVKPEQSHYMKYSKS